MVTLYHFDEENECYVKQVLRRAMWSDVKRRMVGEKGFVIDNTVSIRVPRKEEIAAQVGDVVFAGEQEEDTPPKEGRRIVFAVADNRKMGRRRLRLAHWRIEAK